MVDGRVSMYVIAIGLDRVEILAAGSGAIGRHQLSSLDKISSDSVTEIMPANGDILGRNTLSVYLSPALRYLSESGRNDSISHYKGAIRCGLFGCVLFHDRTCALSHCSLFVKHSRLRCHDPGFTVGRFS